MTRLFGKSLTALMDIIAAVINRFMIPRRQRLNGRPPDLDPYVTHGDVEGPKLADVGAYIQALAASGMVASNPALERRLLEIGDLPQPPDEDVGHVPALDERTIDQVSRTAFSSEQVKVILDVNKALKRGDINWETAVGTLAMALGMEAERAEQFVPPKEDDAEPNGGGSPLSDSPAPPAEPSEPQPAEPAQPSSSDLDDGGDEETRPLGEDEDSEDRDED